MSPVLSLQFFNDDFVQHQYVQDVTQFGSDLTMPCAWRGQWVPAHDTRWDFATWLTAPARGPNAPATPHVWWFRHHRSCWQQRQAWRSSCRLHASGQASRRQLIQIENLERMVCDIADNANYDIVAVMYNGILAWVWVLPAPQDKISRRSRRWYAVQP